MTDAAGKIIGDACTIADQWLIEADELHYVAAVYATYRLVPANHEPCFKRFIRFIFVSYVSVGFETCFICVLCVSLVVNLTLVSLKHFLCISLKLF